VVAQVVVGETAARQAKDAPIRTSRVQFCGPGQLNVVVDHCVDLGYALAGLLSLPAVAAEWWNGGA
jgi:hypothetical protein